MTAAALLSSGRCDHMGEQDQSPRSRAERGGALFAERGGLK
jgi:hypothetical protein